MTGEQATELLKAFKGMFPQEISAVIRTHNEYFGYKLTEGRTLFICNSFESTSKYKKVKCDSDFINLATQFMHARLCFYKFPKSISLGDMDKAEISKPHPVKTLATPYWLTAEETLNYLANITDIKWIWRYKSLKYAWAVFTPDYGQVKCVERVPILLKYTDYAERAHTLSVCNYYVEQGLLNKPTDI